MGRGQAVESEPVRYEEHRLPAPLDRWVECVWMASADAREGGPQRIVPDGCPELIVQLGDPFARVQGSSRAVQPRVAVVGPQHRAIEVAPRGRIQTLGVRFRPGGLSAFVTAPVRELADREVEASVVLGREVSTLDEQLAECASLRTAADTVAAFLAPLCRPRSSDGLGRAAVASLLDRRGLVGMDALAGGLGVTARHLERVFGDSVGLSPKRLARIVRFQDVLRRVETAPERWVDVALDAGFADQSHLSREFRELADTAPSAWLSNARGALDRAFTSPARLDAFFAG